MPSARQFEDLDVWQAARQLAKLVYTITQAGAFNRDFALRDQMRRASVSVLSNIAEGFDSRTQGLFIEFLGRTRGSAGELRAQAYVALDVEYISEAEFQAVSQLASRCSKQISNLIAYLEQQPNRRRIKEQNVAYELPDDTN